MKLTKTVEVWRIWQGCPQTDVLSLKDHLCGRRVEQHLARCGASYFKGKGVVDMGKLNGSICSVHAAATWARKYRGRNLVNLTRRILDFDVDTGVYETVSFKVWAALFGAARLSGIQH